MIRIEVPTVARRFDRAIAPEVVRFPQLPGMQRARTR